MPLFSEYLTLLESIESSPGLYQPFRPDGHVLLWFEQYDRADPELRVAIDRIWRTIRANGW